MTRSSPICVGVVGASGFVGGELCRLLLGHRDVDAILPTSRTAGQQIPFERVHQNLLGCGLEFREEESLLSGSRLPDVVFFCTPSGQAMHQVGRYLDQGVRVVDLSADFRFADADEYLAAHGAPHAAPALQPVAVCGITELYRDQIREARLVANPGCYVIATVLGLAPLIERGLVARGTQLHIAATNGTTGTSATAGHDLHHARVHSSILPYNLDGHRHRLEIRRRLKELCDDELDVQLTTAHGPFARGLVVVATVPLPARGGPWNRHELLDVFRERYGAGDAGEYFVRVKDFPRRTGEKSAKEYDIYPQVAQVMGSNFCHIGGDVDVDAGVLRVVSVVDNLGKGAAGSAVQNMNLMLGFPEAEGLRAFGI